MKQVWNDLLFAHWPVNEDELLPHIPQGLELQTWEGKPWITAAPFYLSHLRLRGIPSLPFASHFLELNVRTYVMRKSKPGIFFLNLEASSRLAVAGARTFAHLPYHFADMSAQYENDKTTIHYASMRKQTNTDDTIFSGAYKPVGTSSYQAQPGSLLHWLTERYCLYTLNSSGQILIGEIHHLPWPLQEAELRLDTNTLTNYHGFPLKSDPTLISYTKKLEVFFWPFQKF
ncbi:DUF2071 domain-containing protein [Paenibacillus dokdonensis]|uniref:DUF2071 domain-containing protein n=1 Tax=Paenibacillus dokdonensis TaxID=2567944 RepID=A0ABU6GJ28_9BACL|nr:DUF2071 domain-containing protein [Paenibacillus dokdonensis]MEC0239749.1 DUF2071 domain-containing protein [Paenibacillus dokdonensis]